MKKEHIVVALLLLLFFAMAVYSISVKSITNDELTHISSGYSYLRTFDFRMNPEHPPLMKLLAGFPILFLNPNFPTDHVTWKQSKQWEFGAQFLYFQGNNTDQIIFWSRIPMILLGMLLGLFVFLFAKELYGLKSAYFALGLYTFSPNILAHTRLVTTDLGLTCFSVMTVYFLYKWLYKHQQRAIWYTGLSFGLAMATKFTAVYLVPIIVLIAGTYLYQEHKKQHIKSFKDKKVKTLVKSLLIIAALGIGITILTYGIINADAYVQGLGNVVYHSQKGHNSYLMGEHSSTGFLEYFPIAFLIKTPIAMILLLLLTFLFYKKCNPHLKNSIKRDLILWIPIIVFFGAFVMNRINIGLRHVLPMYPFLFIFVSQSINIKWDKTKKIIVFGVLILWYVWASISIAPDYLAYFNEAVGGPDNGYKFLIDSNLDWGQDLKQLGFYLKENNISKVKMAYFGKDARAYRNITWDELKCSPEQGLLAVSVNRLVGFDKESAECLSWLRKFEPYDTVGHSIFMYNISKYDIVVPLEDHCESQCRKKCENELQLFSESIYNGTCTCRCAELS